MKIKLPIEYAVYGRIEIEADSIEEAIKKFNADPDLFGLPFETEYIEGSFQLNTDDIEFIKLIQND